MPLAHASQPHDKTGISLHCCDVACPPLLLDHILVSPKRQGISVCIAATASTTIHCIAAEWRQWPVKVVSMANSYQQRVLRRQLSAADYLGSRGADGIDALRRLVAETEASDGDGQALVALPRGWPRAIPLKGACMNGHVRTLAYLVDVCRADVDLLDDETGDTAAHVAVSWGRLDAVAWLLVPVWKSNLRRVRVAMQHPDTG